MKFGINFKSCSENGNFAVIAIMSEIYPNFFEASEVQRFSLKDLVLNQI